MGHQVPFVVYEERLVMIQYRALASILAERWQVVEDFVWQLATERGIDDAVGVQLDGLGDILDEPRGGLGDEAYRTFLRAKILVFRSKGRIIDLAEILRVILPESGFEDLRIQAHPKCAHVQIEATEVAHPPQTWRAINLARAGGTVITFVYSFFAAEENFTASENPSIEEYDNSTGAGWEGDPNLGGRVGGQYQ